MKNLSHDEYHARLHMSATKLKSFMKSPAHYRAMIEADDTDTPAFRFGRMVHTFVLEGSFEFGKLYTMFDGDRRTTAGKRDYEAIVESGREPIKAAEFDTILQIDSAVRGLIPAGETEQTFEAEICGVQCQCRPDRLTADGWVYDLKTCTDITAADRVFYSYGYDIQSQFYEMVLEANGVPVKGMKFVFVEKSAPYDVCVREIDPAIRQAVRKQIKDALEHYKRCAEADMWDGVEGRDLSCKIAPAPAWRLNEASPEIDLSGFYSDENEAC